MTAVVENYIYNYVYILPECYRASFGRDAAYNEFYLVQTDAMGDHDAFAARWLAGHDTLLAVTFTDHVRATVRDTLKSLNVVVAVMILCAGILAFIVVYNLTNINISERVREIATIKVLGFRNMEVNLYIFRENIVMCLMGILLGSGLGYLLAQYMISTVEVSMVTFSRTIYLRSYLYAAALTLGFTLLVNLFMTRRMRAVSMVESLKASE